LRGGLRTSLCAERCGARGEQSYTNEDAHCFLQSLSTHCTEWYFLAVILSRKRIGRLGLIGLITAGLLVSLPGTPFAHDIPSSVRVLAFVKPQGRTLRVVLRAPLEAMRDVNFPQRGPGYLEIDQAGPLLHDATKLWIADDLKLYENDAELPAPTIVSTRVAMPSDRSFESYDHALTTAQSAPLPASLDLPWKQAM